MRWKAFASFRRSKAPVVTIIIAALLAMPVVVLVSTMRSGIVTASSVDNFGFDNIGGSSVFYEYSMVGSVFTCPSDNTISSIVVYTLDEAVGEAFQCAIYDMVDNVLLQGGTTEIRTDLGESPGWYSFNFSTPPTVSTNENYILTCRTEEVTYFWYDNGDGETQGYYQNGELSSFPEQADFIPQDRKYSIYGVFTIPPPSPPQPQLSSPLDNKKISDNTPYFKWDTTENATSYDILVDNDSDCQSPIDNNNVVTTYWTKPSTGYEFGVYYWRVIAKNITGENASDIWKLTISYPHLIVATENASDISRYFATLNASIGYAGPDNVINVHFIYKNETQSYTEGENENWSLNDWYYDNVPIDPVEAGDWDNRTVIWKIAAVDSSSEDRAAADENCDGVNDDIEIQAALSSDNDVTYLYDGTYYIKERLKMKSHRSFVGESVENTIIDGGTEKYIIWQSASSDLDNVLIENLYLKGKGRQHTGEQNGIWIIRGQNIVIKNVRVERVSAIGIYLEGKSPYGIQYAWVRNSEVYLTGDQGIAITQHYTGAITEYIYIDNVRVISSGMGSPMYNGGGGISFHNVRNAIVVNSIFENNGYRGIKIVDSPTLSVTFPTPVPRSENILIRGNKLIRNNILGKVSETEIRVDGGYSENGDNTTRDIIIRGNDIDSIYGIKLNIYTENCIIDNNNFYNTLITIKEFLGSGHLYENNVEPHYENLTPLENIPNSSEDNSYSYILNDPLNPIYYGFKIMANTDSLENVGIFKLFQVGGIDKPQLVYPENNSRHLNPSAVPLKWTNNPNAAYHRLIVDNDENLYLAGGESYIIDLNFPLNENTYTRGLPAAEQYWWKIITIYGDSENSSDIWTFGTNFNPTIENLRITTTENVEVSDLDKQTEYRFWIKIKDNDTLEDIDNLTVSIYLDNVDLPDNVTNHYTFKFINSTGVWSSSPAGYIITENCTSGDNAENTDNYTFAVKFGNAAILTDDNDWDVQVEVYDTYGYQGKVIFENRFNIVGFEGSGTIADPYLIPNVELLQKMNDYKTSHFALDNTIDASSTIGWNGGAGFLPIGNVDNQFTGSLDGRGYVISDLFENRATGEVGLFGRLGSGSVVENTRLENITIIGAYDVGGLAGNAGGTIDNCYSTGSVAASGAAVGGLVGDSYGTVSNSYSTASVTGEKRVGGLIGTVSGGAGVENSYSSGTVIGDNRVGGLVGQMYGGAVSNSYSSSSVSGNYRVGGLVGYTYKAIDNSYSTGSVTGSDNYIGGLVGWNDTGGAISQCYSDSSVSGDNQVGGLVGYNVENVRNSYSTGSVTGYSDIGGLVGRNEGLVSKSYSVGAVTGNGYNIGGLVGYEISYGGAIWHEVETWTNYINAAIPGWWIVETWTNYMDSAGSDWYEVGTWTNHMDAGPMWHVVGTWTNYANAGTLTLYENYDVIMPDMYTWIYGINWRAQTFTVENGNHTVKLVKICAYREGSPGTLVVSVRATNGSGHPTGADLAYGTIDANTFTTNILGEWYGINVTSYPLDNATKYAIVFRALSGTADNEVKWEGDWSSPTYAGGNLEGCADNGSSWDSHDNMYDMLFEIWGYPSSGTVSNSFYDNQTSGQSDAEKGTGLSTTQMQLISTFSDAGWNIALDENYVDEIWHIDNGNDYPRLGWETIGLDWYEVETWTNYMDVMALAWYEVGTWTNYINAAVPGWWVVETWTNYSHVLNWFWVETWTNYIAADTWYLVGTWTNYINAMVTGWHEVGTWTNYIDTGILGWWEVKTWTNYIDVSPPGWHEVATWTNYLEIQITGFISGEVTDIDLNPVEDATITLLGTTLNTITDNLGSYILKAPIDNYDVEASASGYESATIYDVEVLENQTTVVNFQLLQPPPPPPEEFAWGAFMIRFLAVIGPFGVIAWKFTKIKDPVTGAKAAMWALVGFVAFVVLWFVADAVEAVLYAI